MMEHAMELGREKLANFLRIKQSNNQNNKKNNNNQYYDFTF